MDEEMSTEEIIAKLKVLISYFESLKNNREEKLSDTYLP